MGVTPGSSQSQPTGQPAGRIKKQQPKGWYINVRTRFSNVCTFHEMSVAVCTLNISYIALDIQVCTLNVHVYMIQNLYIIVWTCTYMSERCTYMFIPRNVHTMYVPCTYMYIHFKICLYHVCTCLCFSIMVCTMSVNWRTIALYIHCTYMVQTCMYTFMPGGQDSRCCSTEWTASHGEASG